MTAWHLPCTVNTRPNTQIQTDLYVYATSPQDALEKLTKYCSDYNSKAKIPYYEMSSVVLTNIYPLPVIKI